MKLWSVNVSRPRTIPAGSGRTVVTGICKQPVPGRVLLRSLNLDGDGQADLSVHGGPDRAVYVYTVEHYDYWKRQLGRTDLGWGQFGENFTVDGMPEDQVHIGDRFQVGNAVVEVTQPRLPCYKLALRMELPDFPKLFLASGRSGFYLRVVREGEVGAGDAIERIHAEPHQVSVRDLLRFRFQVPVDPAQARRVLRVAALSEDWRATFEEKSRVSHGVTDGN